MRERPEGRGDTEKKEEKREAARVTRRKEVSLSALLYSTLVWRRVAFPPEAFREAHGEPAEESGKGRENKGRKKEGDSPINLADATPRHAVDARRFLCRSYGPRHLSPLPIHHIASDRGSAFLRFPT